MATLLLTTVGTLLGGPVGGALGAVAGRSIDGAVFGSGRREGPRIKELAVTTSSYGQPIPRHHGRMRAAGTIIWATELVEQRDKTGGKKGQPSVTTFSYTSSFAVALASRPIEGVGRIWADGNLLRGAGGDLKVAGSLRIHTGRGDQAPDPLIAAAEGPACPAFRDCAYVVFEDLALADFGNRIPALSFEILADDRAITLADIVDPSGADVSASATLVPLAGFANEGGPLGATLATIDAVIPLACDAGGERLTIAPVDSMAAGLPPLLPQPARASSEGDFGVEDGRRDVREARTSERPHALRYYDVARDFQPGVQRVAGRTASGRGRMIEFPGALHAADARTLAEAAVRRSGWRCERRSWRLAELDAALTPGSEVRIPGQPGNWVVESWEWCTNGVELELARRKPGISSPAVGDPGHAPAPADELPGASILAVFETPPTGLEVESPTLFAAGTCDSGRWSGAALYVDRADELVPVGRLGRIRATIGKLLAPLLGSPGLLFEPQGTLDVELHGDGDGFAPATIAGLAQGANRLLVGGEVLQFAGAKRIGQTTWRLFGLLRGRGGTEPAALAGHQPGTFVVLLDDAPLALDPALVARDAATTLAAIGFGDAEPVYASLANAGLGQKPLTPVHPRIIHDQQGGLILRWARRARGAWLWADGVDAPLIEQEERYRVGLGSVDAPIAVWTTDAPELVLESGSADSLAANHPGLAMWVRQVGSHAQSDPLFLMRFP